MNNSEAAAQWQALASRENHEKYKTFVSIKSKEAQEKRAILVSWIYQIIDLYDLERSLVSFTFWYFDRVVNLCSDLADFKSMQLVVMTCLFVAVKIHGTRTTPLSASRLARLSKGQFMKKQILGMEKRLINILSWYLNPPVPILFLETARYFLYKMRNLTVTKKDSIYNLAVYLIELSAYDHFFVAKRPSAIAAAALQVGLEVSGCNLLLQIHLEPEAKNMTSSCVSRMRKLHLSSNFDTKAGNTEASRCLDSSPLDITPMHKTSPE